MNDNNKPLVSVIMGTYNGEKVISRAIESILNQTHANIELIICDDCSTDNTLPIIKGYASKDSRVVIVRNERNSGLSAALNRCIDVAKGSFIARMDDDDISYPDRIEKQVDYMLKHPEYAIVGTRVNLFDENGVWGQRADIGERGKLDVFMDRTYVHPTVMMRKDALNTVGNYTDTPSVLRSEDYDLWCKFYINGYRGTNMQDVLLKYCESATSVKRRTYKVRFINFKLVLHWRKKLCLPWYYSLYAFKTLIAGLIPKSILLKTRMRLMNKKQVSS